MSADLLTSLRARYGSTMRLALAELDAAAADARAHRVESAGDHASAALRYLAAAEVVYAEATASQEGRRP